MPYIKRDDGRRQALRNGEPARSAGELNYKIFSYIKHNRDNIDKVIIKDFVDRFLGGKPDYQRYNDMTGCLIRCAKEVLRRLDFHPTVLIAIMNSYDTEIANYENLKIRENSDVE